MKFCLVSSAGGHFFQLMQLNEVWSKEERFFVTFDKIDVNSLIKDEKKYYAFYPESRNIINAFRNFLLALKILLKEKPDVMISTGAAIAVPFFIVTKFLKIKTIYIEPVDFIFFPSLTGKIIYFFNLASLFLVQDKKQKKFYKTAKFWGATL